MRSLFNTWPAAFFNPGGGEVQLQESFKSLQKKGVDVSLFNQWKPIKDIDIFHQFSISYGTHHLIDSFKFLQKPIAVSTILWPPSDFPEWGHFYEYVKEICKKSDILLTNSDAESFRLSEQLRLDVTKFHKTRNAISSDYLNTITNSNFRQHYKINGDFVLCVANIDRRKNTASLVQACNDLNLQLVLIGEIRDSAYFDEFMPKQDSIKYLGPINDPHMLKSAYQQCSVFGLPSLCETPGIAALEAASQGAKILITNEGATEEYFQNFATYIDPLNYESLVEGLEKTLKSPNSKSLQNLIANEYTWDKAAIDIIKGYNKVL